MKRRSFLRIFTGAAAAIATGVVGKAVVVASEAAAAAPATMLAGNINPARINAPYECTILFAKGIYERLDPYPLRYEFDSATQTHVEVSRVL
jgi:hypothetical protein